MGTPEVTGRFEAERATNKKPKSQTQNTQHRAPVTQPAASSACHQTSAPRKHVTAVKDGPVQTPSGATEPPTAGSGNNATLLFLTEPPCPALPPPSVGPVWRRAEGQERTEHTPGPGAGRGHVGGEGLPGSLWRSTMCFDNCHHSCSFRDSTQGPSQTKEAA